MHKKSKVKPSLDISGIGSKNNTKDIDILSESMLSASSTIGMKVRKNKNKNKNKNKIKWADDVSIGGDLSKDYKIKNYLHKSKAFEFMGELNNIIIPYLEKCQRQSCDLDLFLCIRLWSVSMKNYLNDTLYRAKALKSSLDRYQKSGYPIDFWLGRVNRGDEVTSAYDLGSESKVNNKIEDLKTRIKVIKKNWPSVRMDSIDIKVEIKNPLANTLSSSTDPLYPLTQEISR
jgi:hypothetical protein